MWKQLAKHGVGNAAGLAKGNAVKKIRIQNMGLISAMSHHNLLFFVRHLLDFLDFVGFRRHLYGVPANRGGGFRLTLTSCTPTSCTSAIERAEFRAREELREPREDLDTDLFLRFALGWKDFMHQQNGPRLKPSLQSLMWSSD